MEKHNILIVDDDQSLLRVMEHHLQEAGYTVYTCTNGKDALQYQKETPATVIFTDIKMPEMTGIEFIKAVKEFDQKVAIVVITGFPTIDTAVETMKEGALDFLQKPVGRDHLLAITAKATEYFQLRNENERLKVLVSEHLDFGKIIGKSPSMLKIYQQAQQVASSKATVLIQGETGTGKEVLAKAIHQNSPRSSNAFVTINCAAVPSTLLESELFGHVKGAFTGAVSDRKGLIEQASGGTFFLDEIGDLPLELQPKLLRVLQEKEIQLVGSNSVKKIDVRFIVATHQNLENMIRENTFREDLYFRLNVVPLVLPPVRERQQDILPLFSHFLKEGARAEGKQMPSIENDVITVLESYKWPGNVREIQNLAQRLMVLINDDTIKVEHLPEPYNTSQSSYSIFQSLPEESIDLEDWVDQLILEALKKNGWNQSKTAKYLNISRNTLIYRMDKRPLLKQYKQR